MDSQKFNESNMSPKVFGTDSGMSAFSNLNTASTEYQNNTVNYLSVLSANEFTQHYTRCTRDSLSLREDDYILDIGCGRGADLAEIADRVGDKGVVVGIDSSEKMISEAGLMNQDKPNVSLTCADGEKLPFSDGFFSAARSIRTLQHVPNPEKVIREMYRVVRPGGKVVVLDPDWEKLVIETKNFPLNMKSTTEAILKVARKTIKNPSIGGKTKQICIDNGFLPLSVIPFIREVNDFSKACSFYSLTRCAKHLVDTGELSLEEQEEWLSLCSDMSEKGEFLLKLTLVMTVCQVPQVH